MPNRFEEPTAGFKQYRASFVGAQTEYGIYSFTGSGTSIEVPTNLSKLVCAIAFATEAHAAEERIFCDLDVDGGAVTVERVGTTSAMTFSYIFIGYA